MLVCYVKKWSKLGATGSWTALISPLHGRRKFRKPQKGGKKIIHTTASGIEFRIIHTGHKLDAIPK
jgi:hypothetical protein